MRITPIQYNATQIYKRRSYSSPQQQVVTKPVYNAEANLQISFYGLAMPKMNVMEEISERTYREAEAYLLDRKRVLSRSGRCGEDISLRDFYLDRLNGIQRGIEVFKGMTMKEIDFIFNNLSHIMIYRGCSNKCSSCIVKADTHVESMAWEDFYSLMDGIYQLRQRLGFNIIKKMNDISLFRDADCIEMELKDRKGQIYDFVDINNLLYKATGKMGMFDTSGWSPTSIKHQKRAEKIVKYFSEEENLAKVSEINISVNPFHDLNELSIRCAQNGDPDGAIKYRELYTDRMANAIFTFTPLLKKDKFNFLTTMTSCNKLYDTDALNSLIKDILAKLERMYENDYSSNRKIYIQGEKQIKDFVKTVSEKITDFKEIGSLGRAEKLFNGIEDKTDFVHIKKHKNVFNECTVMGDNLYTILDLNGDTYKTDVYWLIPMKPKLYLPLSNYKKTIPPHEIVEGITITEKMIDDVYPNYF